MFGFVISWNFLSIFFETLSIIWLFQNRFFFTLLSFIYINIIGDWALIIITRNLGLVFRLIIISIFLILIFSLIVIIICLILIFSFILNWFRYWFGYWFYFVMSINYQIEGWHIKIIDDMSEQLSSSAKLPKVWSPYLFHRLSFESVLSILWIDIFKVNSFYTAFSKKSSIRIWVTKGVEIPSNSRVWLELIFQELMTSLNV